MDWLDFSKYENSNSKFTAKLSNKGGYITFSNSGNKFFTLSLESFLQCLKDILNNLPSFLNNNNYIEQTWRNLGSTYYSDEAANAQSTVQTKPMFATLSKIIMWANSPKYDFNNPEEKIILESEAIKTTISKLEILSNDFSPSHTPLNMTALEEDLVFKNRSIREFAKYVFTHFFGDDWFEIINATRRNTSNLNDISFISHDYEIFKRLIAEFNFIQTKESLTSSSTLRYYEDPILTKDGKFYYFTTQWNGDGDYSLSFSNLKSYFELKFPDYRLKKYNDEYLLLKTLNIPKALFNVNSFIDHLDNSGLIYSKHLLVRFVASLLTKPFLILTGLSGSGKTKLAQSFAQWICENEDQYKIIPVGADWTNREPLLGYPNALEPGKYVSPDSGALELIISAKDNPELPYFLILDEMNLSIVERYFADFLSVMESKEFIPLYPPNSIDNGVPAQLYLPSNLFIIGTVNIDETTNMFSPKVLDRANTIEFRVDENEMESFLKNIKDVDMQKLISKGASMANSFLEMSYNKTFEKDDKEEINSVLVKFFGELKKTGTEFGYRTASEILRLINQLNEVDESLTLNEKIDIAIIQKLLPKLHGSRRKLASPLETLGRFCISDHINIVKDVFDNISFDFNSSNVIYPLSLEKITRMYRSAIDNGFASFAEA